MRQFQRQRPSGVGVGADLGHHQDVVVRADGVADDVVDEAEPVELGGVDVVHTVLDRLPQQRDGVVTTVVQAFELHRPVTDPANDATGERRGLAGHAVVSSDDVVSAMCSSSAR
ncbi:hypothetical protein GCM10029964_052840 [Kibdelosporangium lantanae]